MALFAEGRVIHQRQGRCLSSKQHLVLAPRSETASLGRGVALNRCYSQRPKGGALLLGHLQGVASRVYLGELGLIFCVGHPFALGVDLLLVPVKLLVQVLLKQVLVAIAFFSPGRRRDGHSALGIIDTTFAARPSTNPATWTAQRCNADFFSSMYCAQL